MDSEPTIGPRRGVALALWANAAAVGLLAVALLLGRPGGHEPSRLDLPDFTAAAWGQVPPIAGAGGLYLMPGQLAQNRWGVYVLDVDAHTLMVYSFDAAAKRLDFLAAREILHDRQLGNYNTFPDPLEIRNIAEQERANDRVRRPRN